MTTSTGTLTLPQASMTTINSTMTWIARRKSWTRVWVDGTSQANKIPSLNREKRKTRRRRSWMSNASLRSKNINQKYRLSSWLWLFRDKTETSLIRVEDRNAVRLIKLHLPTASVSIARTSVHLSINSTRPTHLTQFCRVPLVLPFPWTWSNSWAIQMKTHPWAL